MVAWLNQGRGFSGRVGWTVGRELCMFAQELLYTKKSKVVRREVRTQWGED